MWILTGYEDLCLDPVDVEALKRNGPSQELMKDIISAVKSVYNEDATDTESYLYEGVSAGNFLFGVLKPEKLLETIRGWVPAIRKEFVFALSQVYTMGMAPEEIPVDTTDTYNLQKAAMQLNNNWFSYSNYGCYMANSQGFPYFQVFPDKEQMDRVIANPSEYFIIEVYVK